MKKIAILMSTYNGEKFIAEQIESILNQKLNRHQYSISLFIRDDGSNDSTKAIINEYVLNNPNVIYDLHDNMGNLGVKKSFIKLAQTADADFYFFSDQDDIWLPNKIHDMLEVLDTADGKPKGVYSDLWIADDKAQSTGVLMKHGSQNTAKVLKNNGMVSHKELLFTYLVTGASFAFNHKFKDKFLSRAKLSDFQNIRMHDSYIALILSIENGLYYIDKPLVLYRQHSNNVLGATKSHQKKLWDYIIRFREPIENRAQILRDVKLIIDSFDINNSNINELREFIEVFGGKNYWKKWKKINHYSYYLTVSPKLAEKILYTFFVRI